MTPITLKILGPYLIIERLEQKKEFYLPNFHLRNFLSGVEELETLKEDPPDPRLRVLGRHGYLEFRSPDAEPPREDGEPR